MTDATWPGSQVFLGTQVEELNAIESQIDVNHSAARFFNPQMQNLLTQSVKDQYASGKLPVISFKPIDDATGQIYTWREIADNTHTTDGYFRAQRDAFQLWNGKAIVIFSPEPDTADEVADFSPGTGGQTNSVTSQNYKDALAHIMDIFDNNGGTPEVRWATANAGGNISQSWSQAFVPVDSRLTYIGSDPYQWCSAHNGVNENISFADKVAPLKSLAIARDKQAILPEVASYYKTDTSFRASWIDGWVAAVSTFPRLKVACWFNKNVECDFRLQTQAASLTAWEDLLHNAEFSHT